MVCSNVVYAVISSGEGDDAKLKNGEAEPSRATLIFPNLQWIEKVIISRTPQQPIRQDSTQDRPNENIVLLFNTYSESTTIVPKCHGALIKNNWVITTGRCLADRNNDKLVSVTAVAGFAGVKFDTQKK